MGADWMPRCVVKGCNRRALKGLCSFHRPKDQQRPAAALDDEAKLAASEKAKRRRIVRGLPGGFEDMS